MQTPAGLYVHTPFCRRKCAYCDFFSITDQSLIDPFLSALRHEADLVLPEKVLAFDTVYFGGGTPSVLNENQITDIIDLIVKYDKICTENEITVEANPESARLDWLKTIRQAGVNRVSIGVQSFNDDALSFLGRIHSAKQAADAFAAARAAGFDNVSLDLIYGLPGQSRKGLEADLNLAVSLQPEHISCYMLTVESGTPLARSLEKKVFSLPAESTLSDMFLNVSEILARHGYDHYEISNFARDHRYCSRHNSKYWRRETYAGLGPSAHSSFGWQRCWNVKNVAEYVRRLVAGRSPRASGERLSHQQRMTEAIYLGLRLAEGINMAEFDREFGVDFHVLFADVLDRYQSAGLLTLGEAYCRLTVRGMLFHETVAGELVGQLW